MYSSLLLTEINLLFVAAIFDGSPPYFQVIDTIRACHVSFVIYCLMQKIDLLENWLELKFG